MSKNLKYKCTNKSCGVEYSPFAFSKLDNQHCKICQNTVLQVDEDGEFIPQVKQSNFPEKTNAQSDDKLYEKSIKATTLDIDSTSESKNILVDDQKPNQNESQNPISTSSNSPEPALDNQAENSKIRKPTFESNDIVVAELVLPSENQHNLSTVLQFIASIPLPIGFEYFGNSERRMMLLRGSYENLHYVDRKINGHYPAAYLRILEIDPVLIAKRASRLSTQFDINLEKEEYFPLNVSDNYEQTDPVLNMISMTDGLRSGQHLWFQILAIKKGVPDWLPEFQKRKKLEDQKGFMAGEDGMIGTRLPTINTTASNIKLGIVYAYVMIALLTVVLSFLSFGFATGFGILGLVIIIGAILIFLIGFGKQDEWETADLSIAEQKLSQQDSLSFVRIRSVVFAENLNQIDIIKHRIQSTMEQFSLIGGNRLKVSSSKETIQTWLSESDSKFGHWLSNVELAQFWHIPMTVKHSAFSKIAINSVERRSPDPQDVIGDYEIGEYYQTISETGKVNISKNALAKTIFLIGRPGSGKTTSMEHIGLANVLEKNSAVILVDPHGDLADRFKAIIPPEEADRIIVQDLTDPDFLLPYNPLDVNFTGMSTVQTSSYLTDVISAAYPESWGDRMQGVFQMALEFVCTMNKQRPAGQAYGLNLMWNILTTKNKSLQELLINSNVESELRDEYDYEHLKSYLFDYYKNLNHNFKQAVSNPVIQKTNDFNKEPLLSLFSGAKSYLDFQDIFENKKILIINTSISSYGEFMSNLVGSLLINIIIKEVIRQGTKNQEKRNPVVLIVDEFQIFKGVNWDAATNQLRKFGGHLVFGTQLLDSLKETNELLKPKVLTSSYSLFAFSMNADDGKYLSEHELSASGGGPSMETLMNLWPYHCYLRLTTHDNRFATPFLMKTREPAKVSKETLRIIKANQPLYSLSGNDALKNILNNPFQASMDLIAMSEGYTELNTQSAAKGNVLDQENVQQSTHIQNVLLNSGGGFLGTHAKPIDSTAFLNSDNSLLTPTREESETLHDQLFDDFLSQSAADMMGNPNISIDQSQLQNLNNRNQISKSYKDPMEESEETKRQMAEFELLMDMMTQSEDELNFDDLFDEGGD